MNQCRYHIYTGPPILRSVQSSLIFRRRAEVPSRGITVGAIIASCTGPRLINVNRQMRRKPVRNEPASRERARSRDTRCLRRISRIC